MKRMLFFLSIICLMLVSCVAGRGRTGCEYSKGFVGVGGQNPAGMKH